MHVYGVQCLLMGGQACVLYGAAEFSRDADFAVLTSPGNLDRLTNALHELRAEGDRAYWAPLRAELEAMRHARRRTE